MGHSPSVALLRDGELLFMAEEERFNRIKGSDGLMPARAAAWALRSEGIGLSDISVIAFAWDANFYRLRMPLFLAATALKRSPLSLFRKTGASGEISKYQPANIRQLLTEMFRSEGFTGKLPPVRFITHHLAHAAIAFYTSPFDKSDILIIDGSGENKATSGYIGEGDKLKKVFTYTIPDSLGWFYKSVTEYLGYLPDRHEGRVMALASYGEEDEEIQKIFSRIISLKKDGSYRHNPAYSFLGAHRNGKVFGKKMEEDLGPPRFKGEEISQRHKNIARAAQDTLEESVVSLLSRFKNGEGVSSNLCVAGGIALNCRMNGHLSEHPSVENIYLPPLPGDAGTALGAALLVAANLGFNPRFSLTHSYWGPGYSSEEVEAVLKKTKADYSKEKDISGRAAELLAKGNLLGWFQGRLEAGPRALGGRSILADPRDIKTKDIVNKRVKGREKWRPFAPSILKENMNDYLLNPFDSPFMGIAFKTTPKADSDMPAAIHVDSTTRPQIVSRDSSKKYWELIKKFGDLTGVYGLLNTSFNVNEEPIVASPEDALRSFYASGLDYLVIENFILRKGG